MSIVEDLTPETSLWDDCLNWLQQLLLGIVERPGSGNSAYKLAEGMGRWPRLHEALRSYAQYQLGHNEAWTPEKSWNLLLSVLEDAEATLEARNFYAARVLLNLIDPPEEDSFIPGSPPVGYETLAQLRGLDGVAKKAGFSQAVTVRKAYLLGLYNVEAVRSFSFKSSQMNEISTSLLAAMLASIDRVKEQRQQEYGLQVSEATINGGWGPHRAVYSYREGSPYVALNSCHDNPNIGDERSFVSLRQVPAPGWDVPNTWKNDEWVKRDQEYFVRVYVRNCCDTDSSAGPATDAYGVRVLIFLLIGNDRAAVYAVVGADNAATVWDGATLHYDPGVIPQLDEASPKLENNAHPNGGYMLGNEIFSLGGVQIGHGQIDGRIPPGFHWASYITVRLKIVDASLSAQPFQE